MPDPIVLEPVELKICERCGSLWLRPASRPRAYCPACWQKVRRGTQRRRPGRQPAPPPALEGRTA